MYFLLLLLLSPKINKLRWQCERQLLTVNNYSRKNNSDGIFIVMCLRPLYSMLFRICMGCYCCRCRCSRWRNWPSVISKGTRAHCTLMNHDTSLVMCARDRLVICFINLHCNKHSCRLHWFGEAQSIRSIRQWYLLFYFLGFTFQTRNMDNFSSISAEKKFVIFSQSVDSPLESNNNTKTVQCVKSVGHLHAAVFHRKCLIPSDTYIWMCIFSNQHQLYDVKCTFSP